MPRDGDDGGSNGVENSNDIFNGCRVKNKMHVTMTSSDFACVSRSKGSLRRVAGTFIEVISRILSCCRSGVIFAANQELYSFAMK
jgi:hypothetical protein